jgi:hypothetical protein
VVAALVVAMIVVRRRAVHQGMFFNVARESTTKHLSVCVFFFGRSQRLPIAASWSFADSRR